MKISSILGGIALLLFSIVDIVLGAMELSVNGYISGGLFIMSSFMVNPFLLFLIKKRRPEFHFKLMIVSVVILNFLAMLLTPAIA